MSGGSGSDDGRERLTVYLVGHSNVSLESFLSLLQRHSIQSVGDVRSAPYSRWVPRFNRYELKDAVERAGIRYLYLGEDLGGRPEGDEFFDERGYALYYRVPAAPFFAQGLERLAGEAALHRTAVMCSEEDLTNCHWHLLIGRVLDRRGPRVLHIRDDDREQSEDELNPAPDVWATVAGPDEEDETWKSIRPVSRRRPPASSSSPSEGWESNDW
jgi:uncharacterized protein (DUF488 family)